MRWLLRGSGGGAAELALLWAVRGGLAAIAGRRSIRRRTIRFGRCFRSWNIDVSGLPASRFPCSAFGTGTFGGKGDFFAAWGNTDVAEAHAAWSTSASRPASTCSTPPTSIPTGEAEEILGAAIKGRRDKVLISTKATFRFGDGPNDVGSSRYHLIAAVEGALKRLGTDYIDLFQLHGFDAMTPVEEVLSTLDDLVRAGKIRYIGVSNFSGWHLMKSLAVADKLRLSALRRATRPITR